jgi:predicted RNA binding protein YcfA (HicA-like mRNA interferase family)
VKTPRDVGGQQLAKALRSLGYERIRQDGSHIRLTTLVGSEFHITVPNHQPIKVGTLKSILKLVAEHHRMTVEDLLRQLHL